ncbi:LptF/LptG family permease [bacterium]|nr:LptF/LptG family permease [bacterium]
MLKKFDIYIIKKYLSSFFFTMLLITLMAVVIDFSEKINRFIDAELPISRILGEYYLNFIPWINGMMWPLFSLIAVIFFTSRLAKNSEIVALLSSGISFNRIIWPYIVSASIIASLLWVGKNYVIPHSCKIKNNFEAEHLSKKHEKTLNSDVHFFLNPDEKVYIRYYRRADTTAQSFRLEKFSDNKLIEVLKAEKLVFKKAPNEWTFKNYSIREFNGNKETLTKFDRQSKDTILDLTPDDFIQNMKQMENMTTRDLNEFIKREKGRGLGEAKNFLIEKHMRQSQPFTIIILTLIGLAVAARKVRGGMGLHLALGVVIGAAFVILSKFAATFSNNLSLSPALGAWLPNIFFGVIALWLLRGSQK